MIGTDLDSCCNNWATQGLNYYVMAKLLWEHDLDVDALIDDYCRAGFGAGAEAVKAYLLRVEELTDLIAGTEMKYLGPYTPEVVDELRGYLDAAAAATSAADDPRSAARVAFLRAGLEYTDTYAEIFRIGADFAASGERLNDAWKERFRVACDRNWEVSRGMFEDHHLAVNIPNVAWGSWAYFGRFGWSGYTGEPR